jgi:hypothetical protein
MKDRSLMQYQYSQLESLHLRQASYKTKGQPDPVQVRRVAYEVGVGNKAKVELADLRRFSGTIESFEEEAFVINVNGNPQPVKFSDAQKIEKSHMAAWKIALLVVGIVVGALNVLYVIAAATGNVG